jgi:hypothetical protein
MLDSICESGGLADIKKVARNFGKARDSDSLWGTQVIGLEAPFPPSNEPPLPDKIARVNPD